MNSNGSFVADLDRERAAFTVRQRAGAHFVAAAAVVWGIIAVLQVVVSDLVTRNLSVFIASAVLVPMAWGLSKLFSIPFSDSSPLASLGFLMSLNQLAYIPIAMWAYAEAPRRFLMILGVITFAHLLPLGWLYRTRIYTVLTVVGVAALFVLGLTAHPVVVAATAMVLLLAGAAALFATTHRHDPVGDLGSDGSEISPVS